jgi:hypothetical protein
MKFIFKMEDEHSGGSITMESNQETLTEILEDFTEFIRGCGFVISYDSTIEVVDDAYGERIVDNESEEEDLS